MATQPNMMKTTVSSPLAKAADFDFQKEAGPMASATGWSPSENAMASNQLSKLLASDSKLMTQARSMAARSSARRGLLNSSIGVEAGESAAIQSAVPIATQDAGTHARAEEFSANATNQFAMDANRFGRESALTKYQGILAREAQERDQSWRTGENALDRNFTRTENQAGRDFQAGQSQIDRDWRGQQAGLDRDFTRTENQAGRDFQQGENRLNREFQRGERISEQDFRSGQAELDRRQQATLQQNSQDWQAAQNRLNQQFQIDFEKFRLPMNMMAGFSDRMQAFVTQIMSDPNLTPEAREGAIRNYQAYSQQTMGWMASFFGQPMPNMATGGAITPGAQASVPAPAAPSQVGPVNPSPGSVFTQSELAPNVRIQPVDEAGFDGRTARDIYTSGDEELIRRYQESLR